MPQDLIFDSQLEQAKQSARFLYLIHGASFFFSLGLFSIIPLIINYVKRPETAGSFVHSHHTWMIRSFWIYVLCMVMVALLAITLVGIPLAWLLFVFAWLWKAYRLITGFIDLNNNRPMPA
jgi:uncharacterized membrane protein